MKEYIEREALLNSFEELMNIACEQSSPRIGKAMRTGTCAGIAFCRNEVRHAPAADVVEVRHAKWVSLTPPLLLEEFRAMEADTFFECSECKDMCRLIEQDDYYDYCPRCGCKMDKEE